MKKRTNKKTVGQVATDLQSKDYGIVPVLELAGVHQTEHIDDLIKCVAHAQRKLDTFDCSKMPCKKGCENHQFPDFPVKDCYKLDCADYCSKRTGYVGDMYIEYQIKMEKLLLIPRQYFIWHIACPTPNYDQTVYKYHHKDERIEYLWTVPDRDTCLYLLDNAKVVSKDEQQLLDFVCKFADGTLFRAMKLLNGEHEDSTLLKPDSKHIVVA